MDQPIRQGRRSRGFSLIEIIVVMGIIAVLISLLLPAMETARHVARAVQCAGNLRQIGYALHGYASNQRGMLPSWSRWHVAGGDGTGEDEPGPAWTEQLAPYLVGPSSPLYNCPSFPEEYRINYFLGARWLFKTGRRSLKLSEIRRSSEFVLSGDCTQPLLYPPSFGIAFATTDDCDKDDATQQAVVFFGEVNGMNMHRGGNNILFADGHVQIFPSFDPHRITYHPAKMQDWASTTAE